MTFFELFLDTVSARRSSADVDAYSFTDDEEDNEEESAMLKAVAAVKSQKVQKDQKAASNNTVYIPGIGYTTPEGHTNTAVGFFETTTVWERKYSSQIFWKNLFENQEEILWYYSRIY